VFFRFQVMRPPLQAGGGGSSRGIFWLARSALPFHTEDLFKSRRLAELIPLDSYHLFTVSAKVRRPFRRLAH
jgi:hypothetical protein